MTPAVVDTGVGAQQYLPFLHGRKLLISFMTEAELEPWILLVT